MPLPPSAADDDDDGLIIKVPSIGRRNRPRRSDSKTGGAEFDTLLDVGGQLNKGAPNSHRFVNALRENIVSRLRNSFPHMPEDFLFKHSKNAPPSLTPPLLHTHRVPLSSIYQSKRFFLPSFSSRWIRFQIRSSPSLDRPADTHNM